MTNYIGLMRRKLLRNRKMRWLNFVCVIAIVFTPAVYYYLDSNNGSLDDESPRRALAPEVENFGRRRDDGGWYNFSVPPSLLFFAYTAFVDLRTFASSPAGTPVIRVIAISTKFEDQRKRNITVLCVPLHRSSSYRVKTT